MKKSIWILGIIVLFFLGDRIGGFVLKQLTEKSQFRYSRLYMGAAEADILLVGNSRGLIFYEPYIEEITGKKTFNISYNGMPIQLAEVLVKDYLDKYPAPKQMILDITMCDRENSQLIAGYNMYTPYSDRMYDLIYQDDKTTALAGKLTHLFRYNSEIFQRSIFYLNKNDKDWLLDRTMNQNMIDGVNDFPADSISIIEDVFKSLGRTVKSAQAKGVKVDLVINPYYPPFAKRIPNLNELKKCAVEATGLPVRDYSQSVQDINGFGDYQHLNKTGAKEFLEAMQREGVL